VRASSRTSGDDASYVNDVFHASYRRLVAQMYGLCADLAEAEDVVQEAFVRALARPGHFRRLDNPEAWLRTVAVNQIRSRWRRLKRHGRLQHKLAEPEAAAVELAPDHVDLVAALRRLPAAQREVVALHHLGDVPVAEVAQALGVPVGTVKTRLARGRATLARLLDEAAIEGGPSHA
jgi:RNA polymerase sigma-70 factor (sigma-E family)